MSNLANNQPISNQNNPFNNYMYPKTIKSTSSIPHQFSQENNSNLNQFSLSQQNTQNLNESNLTQTLQLHKLIELENIEEIENYLKENNLNQNSLNIEIDYILSKYQKGKNIIYSMLSLFLEKGGDINHSITWKNKNKINNDILYYYFKNSIESKDNITLLMFSIIMNDKYFFDLIIHFNPDINKVDSFNRNAIIYCIIFNDNDNTDILEILINKKANINSITKIEMQPNIYEDHSVLTLACFKNLINVVKVLLKDILLNVNFQTSPNLDTALHIAARFGYDQIAKELLTFSSIYVDIQNKDNKKPIDLAIEYYNNKGGEIYNVFMQYYQNKVNNNNINYGINLNNNNNIIFNNNLGNINNIIVNNNNMINENNINNIELRNNLNIENNSPHSSDIGENVEEELKDKIKNGSNKDKTLLSKNFISFQQNNNNKNSNNINKLNLKKLKNKLNLTQSNKTFSSKLNFEIPIELVKAPSHINKKDFEYFYLKNNYKKNLNNYLKISNSPTFYFDISDKSIESEMKLDELETHLAEKENLIKNFEEKIKEQDNLIKKYKMKLQEKETNLNVCKNLEEEYLKKISELQEEKKNLYERLPKDKLEKDSKKNKSYKEYREFKFKPAKIDDNYIIHILQKDLLDYQIYVQEQILKKNSLVEDLLLKVNILINEISHDFEVKLDGSYANNLSLPWSNIDIILINKNPQNRVDIVFIQKLFINMKNKDWIKKYNAYEDTIKKIYPIIKILTVDKYSNINIDITFQDDFIYIQNKINLINKFLNENAVLKPLILALKTILKNANLNNPNSGGLSSYGLILMIVSYIQNQKENNIFSENDEDFLGKIFYGFLQHYGLSFDFNKYVILTYPNNLDNGNNINFGQNNHELIIIDPLDKNNNVAKNTKQFMNLKMAFMIAFMITKEDCECGCHYGRALYEYSLTSTEHCILKRMFNSVKRFSENSN